MIEKSDIFRPQSEFPLLEEFVKKFEIDNDTVFAYNNKIYTNNELTPDLIVHEYTHLKQQNELEVDRFVEKYLTDIRFRLTMEVEAFRAQLESIKDEGLREAVRQDSAETLSSALYGNIITTQEAYNLLK